MSDEGHTELIGYKRPPRQHQFCPGQSGNPKGRPKGARNFKSELREVLAELIQFRDGDREVEISKQRALIKRFVASAIEGDQRAAAALLAICLRVFADADEEDAEDAGSDREIVEIFNKSKAQRNSTSARLVTKGA